MMRPRRPHRRNGLNEPGQRRRSRKWDWEDHLRDSRLVDRISMAVWMASSMEMESPSRNAMGIRFGIGHVVVDRHLADLVRQGVINRDLRVLPGWKERLLDATR